MKVEKLDLGDGVTKMRLDGKLDIAGAEVVGMPLSIAAGSGKFIIVDMSDVSFVASIGVRHLVMAAKAAGQRNSALVLLSPTPTVEQILDTMGIVEIIPIVRSEDEARAHFGGGSSPAA